MTVSRALQSAALRLHGVQMSTFFGSNDLFAVELCDLVNEVARDVAAAHDWQRLTKVERWLGDGVQEKFPFPADYDRQLVRSDIQTSNGFLFNYQAVPDINDFLRIKELGLFLPPGIWCIYENEIHFTPPPNSGFSSFYPYVSKNIVHDQLGVWKPEFTEDTDTFFQSNRLLTLGLVWRYRELKKLDYTGDQEAFEKVLGEEMTHDKGSRIIRSNPRFRGLMNTNLAYPYPLG